jgi:putative hydrolase
VSTPGPFGPLGGGGDDPLKGLFGDLARMLGGQGDGFRWDAARQFAMQVATGGRSEDNPDPLERIQLEQLIRVAELQVGQATGLSTSVTGRPLTVRAVTRAGWVHESGDAYKPLFEALAASLAAGVTGADAGAEIGAGVDPDEHDLDPMAAMLGPLMQAFAPMLLAMTAGSLLGHLAQRSFGQYDLPVPRQPTDELLLVPANIAEFGEAWSLPGDDLRLWVCLHEVAHHAVLGLPHVRDRLRTLLVDYAAGFRTGGSGLDDRLAQVDLADPTSLDSLEAFQEAFADPEVLLGAIRSDEQRALIPQLEALVAAVVGYVAHVMDGIGERLIGSYGMLTEALRRRRVEADASDRFVEQLLGLQLDTAAYERGRAFVDGIHERAGDEGVARLWRSERELPTPAEIDAPGLWLARIDLPA